MYFRVLVKFYVCTCIHDIDEFRLHTIISLTRSSACVPFVEMVLVFFSEFLLAPTVNQWQCHVHYLDVGASIHQLVQQLI